ncbi:hypothetical protein ABG067_003547 [Albugo candida]
MSILEKNPHDQISFEGGIQAGYDPVLGTYNNVKSPNRTSVRSSDACFVDRGSLRSGRCVDILSRGGIGLLHQHAVVGFLHGVIPAILFPFFLNYLNTESTVAVAASALMDIPWSLKFFFGMLTDNVPILGYRRRPFMLLGWMICGVSLLVASLRTMPRPYYPDPAWRTIKPKDYTDTIKENINYSAQNEARSYTIFFAIATFGYILADSTADAVMIEYAQREPHAMRGTIQAGCTFVRSIFAVLAHIVIMFGLNSEDYGGTFTFAFSISNILLLLALFVFSAIPITWLMVYEEIFLAVDFREYIRKLWEMLQSRVVYQVIGFSMLTSFLVSIENVADEVIMVYWMRISPLTLNIIAIAAFSLYGAGIFISGRYGLMWSWRKTLAFCIIFLVIIDVMYALPVCFNVVRSSWILYARVILQSIPLGIHFMVELYVIVELCNEGAEGTCAGLLTTIMNLGSPLAASFTKAISSSFAVTNEDIQNDSMETRRDAAILYLIPAAAKIGTLLLLPLLPRQKAETLELKNRGGSKAMGIFTIAYLVLVWGWSLLVNCLTMFESTRCLAIAGGCKKG